MRTRPLGNSDLKVSAISLGSWLTFGESVDPDATRVLVRRAFELGVTLFDTADVYANGDAERALGKALHGIQREHIVIATKCFFPMSEAATDRGLSRKHVHESVEHSLRRLDTDYIDLHQCHRFDPETPLEETVRAYSDLIRQGKLLYWGVSMWTADQISAACEIADATGGYRPISNQPVYSILRRQLENDVLPRCRQYGIGQIVFSPLGQGALTGKYSGGTLPPGSRATDSRLGRWMGRYLAPETLERIDELAPIARDCGMTMPQLALAWCLRDPAISSVIIGATRVEQLAENCEAADLNLPPDAASAIDALFQPGSESLPPDEGNL
jgi:voltage-dependent potassium channel beta subunit